MSRLRIARIPYLNSVPFYGELGGGRYELIGMPPRELGQLAAEGKVDAGILSLCDLLRSDTFEALGSCGISLDGPAHSVLLFLRDDPAKLDGRTIAITGETSTSYPLLRLLLEQYVGVTPEYVRRPAGPAPDDAAALFIGDAALRLAAAGGLVPGLADYSAELISLARPTEGDWEHVLDLGTAWKRWQGLPFVFARWAAAAHVTTEDRNELITRIEHALAASTVTLDQLAADNAAEAGLDGEAAHAYLAAFGYTFGEAEEAGQARFIELLGAAPWWTTKPEPVPVGLDS